MDTQSFDRILLRSVFCCMASDGHMDKKELELIKTMCADSPLFQNFDINSEINSLVCEINQKNKDFISEYFTLLNNANLSENEELMLIDFAIRTIQADDKVEYSEVKFFQNIRHRLKISDETALEKYPDYEVFFIEDIVTESYLDKISSDYLDNIQLSGFEDINFDVNELENDSE